MATKAEQIEQVEQLLNRLAGRIDAARPRVAEFVDWHLRIAQIRIDLAKLAEQ